ncbi:ATPase AAA [Asanoa ishikariensis]|uniref:MoxR-like ATPase n=1 Tax=Asanoa ishikariensis TaxID=137265 RepID=A0A1H3TPL7_9ACTN|nr:MoxR family ATPase [Asanoa ishikariensis]GIF62082.1 ATPase AAA [Asanoa ishikariensis]SDZ51771.1 MoxR-like ATPase [Asanoa ishikariensis]
MTDAETTRIRVPDNRDGRTYVIDPDVAFAVDVALATGRPLLLRGEPGSGKSSLAAYVARERGWRYYEHVVTSRTAARDLLWTFDAVRRLADAQVRTPGERLDDTAYVEPGVLWWAFAPQDARRRGARATGSTAPLAVDPNPANADRSPTKAVVLIDEIDKADPDMPNGILVPLGSSEFEVTDVRTRVRHDANAGRGDVEHLIVITTNEERELPQAFLRRCVVTWLPEPTHEHLLRVAERYLRQYEGTFGRADRELADALAVEVIAARAQARQAGIRPPSTAEYLDTLRALRQLGGRIGDVDWRRLRSLTLVKVQQPER